MDFAQALIDLEPLLRRRAARMIDGRYYGSGAPLAQDLAQQTLAHLSTDRTRTLLEAKAFEDIRRYAYRSLHNAFIDHCARKRREYTSEDSVLHTAADDDAEGPEAAAIAKDERDRKLAALNAALSQLSTDEQTFLSTCMDLGSAPAAQRKLGWPKGGAANACERRGSLLRRVQAAVMDAMASAEDKRRQSGEGGRP